jgi:hypothetical protein
MLMTLSIVLLLIAIGLLGSAMRYYCDLTDLWQFWLSIIFFVAGGVVGIYAFI